MTTNPAAGWHRDPSFPDQERYWDGTKWSEEVRPAGSDGGQPAPPPPLDSQQDATAPAFSAAQAGNPNAAPQMAPQYIAPQPETKKNTGCFGVAGGVMFGIIGAFALLLVGCVGLIALSSGAEDGTVSIPTSDNAGSSDSGDGTASEGSEESTAGEELPESADIVSCERLAEDEVVLEIINNSSGTSSYSMTIGFFDDEGTRVADEAAFLDSLRPGERAIESKFTFESAGTTCEVIDVDRFASVSQADEVPDVGPCEITGQSALGDIEATVSATNSSENTSSYSINLAFVDAEGIRRGNGDVFIDAVRPDETAPGDAFTTLDFDPGLRCEVVGVNRTQS